MLSDAFLDLGDDEPLQRLSHVADRLYTGLAPEGWSSVCCWASKVEGGQWWPKEKGLTWCMGSRYAWVVTVDQVEAIMSARAIVLDLGLDCGWSIGSAARALLRYVGPPQYHYKSSLGLLLETGNAYLECAPGEYPDSILWDCKSYYYTLMSRLPTWRVTLGGGDRLRLHGNLPGEEARRAEVLARVGGHKLLRNALVGCMTGREAGAVYYHAGRRKTHRGGPGPFRGAGLLIRRTGWELARRAAVDTGSVLSNTDCVLSQGGRFPDVWADYGLIVEQRLDGDADVCSPITWRVGSHPTKFYAEGSRFLDPISRPAEPRSCYTSAWLRRAS